MYKYWHSMLYIYIHSAYIYISCAVLLTVDSKQCSGTVNIIMCLFVVAVGGGTVDATEETA